MPRPDGIVGDPAPELEGKDPEGHYGEASSSSRKRPGTERFPQQARSTRRLRAKTPLSEMLEDDEQGHLRGDEVMAENLHDDRHQDGGTEEAMMTKRAKTARGREKQLEKEIPWGKDPS